MFHRWVKAQTYISFPPRLIADGNDTEVSGHVGRSFIQDQAESICPQIQIYYIFAQFLNFSRIFANPSSKLDNVWNSSLIIPNSLFSYATLNLSLASFAESVKRADSCTGKTDHTTSKWCNPACSPSHLAH